MDLLDAIKARHSVRSFTGAKIEGETEKQLRLAVEECNRDSGLNIQLCLNEPRAFDSMMARYGKFKNVKNYVALVGKPGEGFEEKCGYYGEKIVLRAMQLGLNSCWVAMSYSKGKSAAVVGNGEKLLMVIALGYGDTSGASHETKTLETLCRVKGTMPEWFRSGMMAAMMAPTAMNQQKFLFTLEGNTVSPEALSGFYTKTDLGIVKYHFEIGAGAGDWKWKG